MTLEVKLPSWDVNIRLEVKSTGPFRVKSFAYVRLLTLVMEACKLVLASVVDQDIARFEHSMLLSVQNSIRRFKINDGLSDCKYVWGITSSKTHYQIWEEMLPGDYIFFFNEDNFKYYAKLEGKLNSKEISESLWRNHHLFAGSFNLLFFFKTLYSILIPFHKFEATFNIKKPGLSLQRTFFISVDAKQVNKVITKFGSIEKALGLTDNLEALPDTKKASEIQIADYEDSPQKRATFVTRFIRDTIKSIELKKKYSDHCQICHYCIEIGSYRYSEVHHVWPLGEGGFDNFDNMIVLCPNHHAEFDLAVIGIDPGDGRSIIDLKGNILGKLTFRNDHHLNASSLKYQMKRMQNYPNDSKRSITKVRL